MSVPDAMQTTFKGDGPTTHVTIPRDMAEADLGSDFDTAEAFAAWIDTNNDRLYAAALVRRETDTLYESVTLRSGDLSRVAVQALTLPGATDGDVVFDPAETDARVIAIGEPVEAADPLFVGTLTAALDHVLARDPEYRRSVGIWTESRLYGEADFDRMRPLQATD